MTPAMFARLKTTVERDGRLESLPFCALTEKDPPRIEIISGHHRTRAARAAELFYVACLVDETGLTPDPIKAKQLAHNAIAGESEPQLLTRIFESITDVDARLEAFIEPSKSTLAPVRLPRLDVDLGYRVIQLVMLPHMADAFDKAVDQLAEDAALVEDASKLYLVDMDLDEWWRAACRRMGKEHGARAVTVQVARLVDAAMTHLGLAEGEDVDPDEWVPLSDLLGSALVPPDVAETIREVVAAMTKAGKAEPRRGWQAVAELAAAYLDPR
jgi:ParB-like chromosome segregation protein Spo0J